jgi:hypothetical protein
MARKNLLTESEIRSFMKLANLKHIGETQIDEMALPATDIEEEMDDLDDDALGGEEADMDLDVELGDDEGELDMDMDMDADLGGSDMSGKSAEELVSVAADALEALAALADVDVDVEDDSEAELEDVPGGRDGYMQESDDENLEEGEDELEEVSFGRGRPSLRQTARTRGDRTTGTGSVTHDPEGESEVLPGDDSDERPSGRSPQAKRPRPMGVQSTRMQEDAIVAEVAKRVAARLQDGKNKQELIENLTEKILNRLTK